MLPHIYVRLHIIDLAVIPGLISFCWFHFLLLSPLIFDLQPVRADVPDVPGSGFFLLKGSHTTLLTLTEDERLN